MTSPSTAPAPAHAAAASPVPSRRDGGPPPLHVMHVVDRLVLAGMEYGVIKLVNRMDRSRFLPSICCLRTQAEESRAGLDPAIPVRALGLDPRRTLVTVRALRAVFREERVHVVHSHNWQTMLAAIVAARAARVPVVVHGEHGRDEERIPARRLLLKRLLARGADRLVAVSDELRKELIRDWHLGPDRIVFIPNGVDTDRFRDRGSQPELRAALGLERTSRVVLNIGGFRAIKDHDTLIRAFAEVHRELPAARLLLVGSDDQWGLKPGLERLARELGAGEAVRFAGVRQDVPELLSLCDVYVNSSRSEGMSNTILEAMASARPVVATRVGGNVELVRDGDTGYLVPAADPLSLGARILDLLTNPDRRRAMGGAARAMVERQHPMDGMVGANERLYEEAWRLRAAPSRLAEATA